MFSMFEKWLLLLLKLLILFLLFSSSKQETFEYKLSVLLALFHLSSFLIA